MGTGYLIDTNAIIDFLMGNLPETASKKMMSMKPVISVITQIELFSSNKTTFDELQKLNAFIAEATIYNILDDGIVRQAADLRLKYKLKTPDAIIAATAIVKDLTLVTRNVVDFKIPQLNLLNPWQIQ